MTRMRPYIGVMHQQMLNSVAKLISFRVSFVLLMMVEVTAICTAYLPVNFLFHHVEQLGPWNREQFMFFVFWNQCMFCCHNGLIAPNFWNLSTEIRTGALDFRLLRPLGSVFDVMTAINRPASLILLPVSVGLLIYYGIQINLSVTAWIMLPFTFCLAFLVMCLTELNIAFLSFWTKGGDSANFVRMQCQQVQRWPDFMYPARSRMMFTTVLPVLLSGSFGVGFLFDTSRIDLVGYMLVAVVVFCFLASFVWRLAIRRYESASS